MHSFSNYSLDSFIMVVTRAVDSARLKPEKKEDPQKKKEKEKEKGEEGEENKKSWS